MTEQLIASIQNYFYKMNPVKIFSDKVPKSVVYPSMYFSLPDVSDAVFSKQSFEELFIVRVKLFEKKSDDAFNKAQTIAQSIRKNKFCIPIINKDGTEDLTKQITFESINAVKIEDSVAQVTLTFSHYMNFE